MKRNILCIVLSCTLAVCTFSACGRRTASDAAQQANSTEILSDWQNPVVYYLGRYQNDRRTMLVEADGQDGAKLTVSWGDSATSAMEWTIRGKLADTGTDWTLRYADGERAMVVTDETGKQTRTVESSECTGVVRFLSDGSISWTDDADERIRDVNFKKAE